MKLELGRAPVEMRVPGSGGVHGWKERWRLGEIQGGEGLGVAALSPVAVLGVVTTWEEKQEAAMRPSARRPI